MSDQRQPGNDPINPDNKAQADGNHQLSVVICPGFHDSALTEQMVQQLPSFTDHHILDTAAVNPVDPLAVHQWLIKTLGMPTDAIATPIVGIGFSAGVVGLAGGLALWQQQGGKVARLIAVDGWGVPVIGLPVSRISHDRFTHLSTVLPASPLEFIGELFSGDISSDTHTENFYAEPPVEHLALWGDLEAAHGWQIDPGQIDRWQDADKPGLPMSAADFLRRTLRAEWNQVFNWR